ncbi:MAG: complex proteins associated with Set1p component shg1-domain-containing protein [Benjaminiella poitrasii]|nr:MAG: complex proteins associated with Set1p component shg1-domain-containing protein [Benjaminiella poitrasii]
MSPEEEIVSRLKRNGTFDSMRKQILVEFQTGDAGQKFLDKLRAFMEDMVNKDPNLLEKDSSFFYDQVSAELERSGLYQTIREEILDTLKEDSHQNKIDEEILFVTEDEEKN